MINLPYENKITRYHKNIIIIIIFLVFISIRNPPIAAIILKSEVLLWVNTEYAADIKKF